jgi:lysozyme
MESINEMLIEHEDLRQFVYDDATGLPIVKGTLVKGNPTIGVGRNLVGRGITKEEALYLLNNDIKSFTEELTRAIPWFASQPEEIRNVLIDMGFNMGVGKLLGFKNTLELIHQGNYKRASVEMLKSTWAKQVGNRAVELSNILKSIT